MKIKKEITQETIIVFYRIWGLLWKVMINAQKQQALRKGGNSSMKDFVVEQHICGVVNNTRQPSRETRIYLIIIGSTTRLRAAPDTG